MSGHLRLLHFYREKERLGAQVPDAQTCLVELSHRAEHVAHDFLHLTLRKSFVSLLAILTGNLGAHVAHLTTVEEQLGDAAAVSILLHNVAVVLCLHEFLRADHVGAAKDIQRS